MALIILLPSAAQSPVLNPSRRGRYPAGVVSLSACRAKLAQRLAEIEALTRRIETLNGSRELFMSAIGEEQYKCALKKQKLERGEEVSA